MFPKDPHEMLPQMDNAGVDPMMMQGVLQARNTVEHAPDGPPISDQDNPLFQDSGTPVAHIDPASLGMEEDAFIEDMLMQRIMSEGQATDQFQDQAVAENMKIK
jgi:hypothetical protein